jgi:serine/threonine protein phosphatase PrpC
VDIVASEKEKNPFKAAAKLRDSAYLLDSEDNISVLIVYLK